jgi:hypothetical protein
MFRTERRPGYTIHANETHFRSSPPTTRRYNGTYELDNMPGEPPVRNLKTLPSASYHNSAMNGEDTQTLRIHHRNGQSTTTDEIEVTPLRKASVHLKSSADLERNSQHGYAFSQDDGNFARAALIYHPTSHRV